MTQAPSSFFSIGYANITLDAELPYDLYINSSSVQNHEKFVRIFPKGETFAQPDLERLKHKFHQLYVPETQRSDYLKSFCKSSGKKIEEKASLIKDSAIHYLTNLFNREGELSVEMVNETITGCRDAVENMVDVLHDVNIDSLQSLIGKLSFHDFYTYDHSINVSMYCIMIYRHLNPNAAREEIIEAGMGGLLHDIGKIQIPTQIINKPGKLEPHEFEEIKKHPGFGKAALTMGGIQLPDGIHSEPIVSTVHEHHENFDGTGYPQKIAGTKIHLMARICAVADFFDAITTKRSYAEPLSIPDALALMSKTTGKKIDPTIFEAFSKLTMAKYEHDHCKHELTENFDPCQPGSKVQKLAEPQPAHIAPTRIEPAPNGKVVLMDPAKHKPAQKKPASAAPAKPASRILKKTS